MYMYPAENLLSKTLEAYVLCMTRPLIKTQHQTSFAENFLKPLALLRYFTWVMRICCG